MGKEFFILLVVTLVRLLSSAIITTLVKWEGTCNHVGLSASFCLFLRCIVDRTVVPRTHESIEKTVIKMRCLMLTSTLGCLNCSKLLCLGVHVS